jgi:hypothetical protein
VAIAPSGARGGRAGRGAALRAHRRAVHAHGARAGLRARAGTGHRPRALPFDLADQPLLWRHRDGGAPAATGPALRRLPLPGAGAVGARGVGASSAAPGRGRRRPAFDVGAGRGRAGPRARAPLARLRGVGMGTPPRAGALSAAPPMGARASSSCASRSASGCSPCFSSASSPAAG